ncbi:hypothetical protein BG003_010600 [Podila horticola]|nr:hypothetical protein BG003_010600 [Podila horticola]
MSYYHIARYFNIASYATFLVSDITVHMASVQDDKFLAQFHNDYLAIVLITTYAVSELSENVHFFLSMFMLVSSLWHIFVVTTVLHDVVCHRRTLSFEFSYIDSEGSDRDDKFLPQFYSDYLAIVLIIAYTVSNISETAHLCLSLWILVFGWIWPLRLLIGLLQDLMASQDQVSVSIKVRRDEDVPSVWLYATTTESFVHDRDGQSTLTYERGSPIFLKRPLQSKRQHL